MTLGRKSALCFVALDTLSVVVVFNLFAFLRNLGENNGPILLPLMMPWVAIGIALYLIDGYKIRTDMVSLDYTSMHTIALLSALLVSLLVTFVVFPRGYPLQQSRAVIALGFVMMIPVTLSYRRALYLRVSRRRGDRSIVFVGDQASGISFKAECARAEMSQPIIYATGGSSNTAPFIDVQDPRVPFTEVLGRVKKGELGVEAIVLRESNRDLSLEVSQQLVDLYFGGVPTYTLELFHQVYWRKIPIYRLNQTWLFQEGFPITREPVFERLKRVSDLILAAFGLTFGAPIFLVAALVVWGDDRGPVFFRQMRVGKNRRPFQLYKFRTMRPNTPGNPYAQKGDQRVTRAGKWLRASRLDELPQLINVLRGEMSLIGPRAEWDRLVESYEQHIPCYHFRHLVRPGITGWAQVNYPYGAGLDDTVRKLEYDLYYIRHFSFSLDASIVLKTIHVMLFGKGR